MYTLQNNISNSVTEKDQLKWLKVLFNSSDAKTVRQSTRNQICFLIKYTHIFISQINDLHSEEKGGLDLVFKGGLNLTFRFFLAAIYLLAVAMLEVAAE